MEGAREFVAAQRLEGAAAVSYEQLLEREDVDGVYISLPNSMHAEWTIRALRAGKHVLCEKPLATSPREAEEMFEAAERAGRLLVEAFMYVSHPLTRAVREAVGRGDIGRLRHIRTSFCYRTNKINGNVRFDPSLAGGALMDVGCYCLHFSRMLAGADPVSVAAELCMHPSGVDHQVSGLMRFPGELTATFTAGMSLQADNTATLSGEEGYIEVPIPWKPPVVGAKWVVARGIPPKMDGAGSGHAGPVVSPRQEFAVDAPMGLYAMEADDFAAAAAGEIAPAVSREDSLANARMIEWVWRSGTGG